jgi:hypothetical protein
MGPRRCSVRFALHIRAIERHAEWAREFAVVGEDAAVAAEMSDIQALVEELRSTMIAWPAPP